MFKFIANFLGITKKPKEVDGFEEALLRSRKNTYSRASDIGYHRDNQMKKTLKLVETPKYESAPVSKKEDTFVEDVVTAIVVESIIDNIFDSSSSNSSSDSSSSDWSGDGGGFSGGGSSGDW